MIKMIVMWWTWWPLSESVEAVGIVMKGSSSSINCRLGHIELSSDEIHLKGHRDYSILKYAAIWEGF